MKPFKGKSFVIKKKKVLSKSLSFVVLFDLYCVYCCVQPEIAGSLTDSLQKHLIAYVISYELFLQENIHKQVFYIMGHGTE